MLTVRKSTFEALNVLKDLAYETAKAAGFHNSKRKPVFGNYTSNLTGEVSELWEAYRAGTLHKPCDKSEKMIAATGEFLTCMEEELADIILRVLDTAAVFNIDIGRAIRIKNEYNKTRPYRHGNKKA